MRQSLRLPLLAASFVAFTAPALAQQSLDKVMLPWQQARPKPAAPQPSAETLPWDEAPREALPWTASSSVGSGIETGSVERPPLPNDRVAPNGLVLKQGHPAAEARPVQSIAVDSANRPTEDFAKPAPATLAQAAPPRPAASPEMPRAPVPPAVSAPVPPKPIETVAQAAAPVAPQSVPATAVPPSPRTEPVDRAAAAVTEEAAPIPAPLPDAIVTPVVPKGESMPVSVAVNAAAVKPAMPRELPEGANVAQQYCFNIADAAKDARYAWQKKTLVDIEEELKKRIAQLDARTAEYQKWLARRDEFIRQAEENVVKIYAGMRPDAASVQLSQMHEETAAAILTKIGARPASAIMNEMDAAKAAKLAMIITGAAKLKKKEAAAATAASGASERQPEKSVPANTQPAANGGRS